MSTMLKGKNAKLLSDGCMLDKEIKEKTAKLKEIKEAFGKSLGKGTYTNNLGDVMTISVTAKYADVSPEAAYNELKKIRKSKEIFNCVKVQITPLKKIMSVYGIEKVLDKIRKVTGETIRISFK